ncbi:EKC/KEOPS complex subunit LAGE3 [Tupaia chinensis]|uniref:EKC/KEOPS complex subunit LAGE3 n=1 Tax=Tupaia chinensis TaxID=246437 RepID=UPI0003C91694|nr:EKC/KEOPS complex subunit LAGE3 [Tupaia chinensis]
MGGRDTREGRGLLQRSQEAREHSGSVCRTAPYLVSTSTLSVPFPTPLEAEIARGSLAPDAEPHRGAVGKELKVSGSVLAVCWRAEDSRLLRVSIVSFLEQLSLVVRTMQRFGPPVSR